MDWGAIDHLGAGLLLLAAASGRMRVLRLWLLAAGAALFAAALLRGDAIGMVWAGALTFVTALHLGGALLKGGRVTFSDEERALAALLDGLGKSEARHFLDQGLWLDARRGDVITTAGEPVSHLYFLSAGSALVSTGGSVIGEVPAGSFIGEVTVLTGRPATGTVEIAAPSRLWCVPATALRAYVDDHDDVRRALEAAFREALSDKLVASNRLIAAGG